MRRLLTTLPPWAVEQGSAILLSGAVGFYLSETKGHACAVNSRNGIGRRRGGIVSAKPAAFHLTAAPGCGTAVLDQRSRSSSSASGNTT
jgi:hypothetical protein